MNKDKTPYELWYGRPTSVKYFRVFGSNFSIKRNEDDLGKFDSRNDEEIFLGYSSTKKEYRCYNKRLHKIVESADVRIDDIKPRRTRIHDGDENMNNEEEEDLQKDKSIHDEEEREEEDTQESKEYSPRYYKKTPSRRVQKDHLETQIISDKDVGVRTRRQLLFNEKAPLSVVEPKNFTESNKNDEWIKAMNEELDHIERNETWEIVPRPKD